MLTLLALVLDVLKDASCVGRTELAGIGSCFGGRSMSESQFNVDLVAGVRCYTTSVQINKLQPAKKPESCRLFVGGTEAALVQRHLLPVHVLECICAVQIREHVTSRRLLPTSLRPQFLNEKLDQFGCFLCDQVAFLSTCFIWVKALRSTR